MFVVYQLRLLFQGELAEFRIEVGISDNIKKFILVDSVPNKHQNPRKCHRIWVSRGSLKTKKKTLRSKPAFLKKKQLKISQICQQVHQRRIFFFSTRNIVEEMREKKFFPVFLKVTNDDVTKSQD